MRVNYVPITEAIKDFVEDNDLTDVEIDEELLKKWALTVVELLSTDQQLIHKIGIFDVRNYKVELPEDFSIVCEIAYRKSYDETCNYSRQEMITQWVTDSNDGCELEINVKCPTCHKTNCTECGQNTVVVDVDRMWEQSHAFLDHINNYSRVSRFGFGSSTYDPNFRLLRYGGDNWDGLSKHFPNCMNLQSTSTHTYVFNLPYIEVSFEEGELIISYLAKQLDDNGDLMIPNHPSVFEAIIEYLTYKWHRKMYFRNKDMANYRAYKDAQAMSDIAIGRARSALQIPSFQEFSAWIKNNKKYKLNESYQNLLNHGNSFYSNRYKGRDTNKR